MPIKNDGQRPSFWVRNPLGTKQVTKLWMEGISASEIIKRLGLEREVTRNAVIGKMHRIGRIGHLRSLPAGSRPKLEKSAPKPKVYRVEKPLSITKAEGLPVTSGTWINDIPNEDIVTAVHLYDAKSHHCRWPVAHMMYCGARSIPGARLSYCPEHYDRSTARNRGPAYVKKHFASKYR